MSKKKYTGYHGTKKDAADSIIRVDFRLSQHGWLGKGVYFFEDNLERAKDWARFCYQKNITEVIEAKLEVPSEKVFDTTREDHQNEFHEFREALVNQNLERGKFQVKTRNQQDFDGKVYNAIADVRKSCLIRAKTFTQPFAERGKSIPRSRVPNAVELCLKNTIYVKSKSKVSLSQEEGLI